jgi:hypothetical protein
MKRHLDSLRFENLDERVLSSRLLTRSLNDGQGDAEPPSRLALPLSEPEDPTSGICVHQLLLSVIPTGLIPARLTTN